MPSIPLFLNKTIGPDDETDRNDVVITKRQLERLGIAQKPIFGATGHPDDELFEGIKQFQSKRSLKVDGVIKPNGPTATELGRELSRLPTTTGPLASKGDSEEDRKRECDRLYFDEWVPMCRRVGAKHGMRAEAVCQHTAASRYGACLDGKPRDQWPPIVTPGKIIR